MTAPRKEKKRKKKVKEGNPVPNRSPMGTPTPASYLKMTLALTSPTFVPSKNLRTASVYRSFDSKSLTDVLLGLARACLTLYPKPFLLLKGSSVCSLPPEASLTAVHSSLISVVQALHSLKRCSLLCLPLLHHQQPSESVQPHLSFRKEAVIAWPLSSWKNLAYHSLVTLLGWGRNDVCEQHLYLEVRKVWRDREVC